MHGAATSGYTQQLSTYGLELHENGYVVHSAYFVDFTEKCFSFPITSRINVSLKMHVFPFTFRWHRLSYTYPPTRVSNSCLWWTKKFPNIVDLSNFCLAHHRNQCFPRVLSCLWIRQELFKTHQIIHRRESRVFRPLQHPIISSDNTPTMPSQNLH